MLNGESEGASNGDKEQRTVVVHGSTPFGLPFKERLLSKFQLVHSAESAHFSRAKVMLCMDHTPITPETLQNFPSLEYIVASSAGVDHIDLTACRLRGITVTNGSQAFSEEVADYAIALLIDVLRKISAGDRHVRSGLWPVQGEYPLGSKLGGKRVGIVGLGNIGSEIAKRLVAFGCSIVYNSRNKRPSVAFPYYANVCELAANSDVLILCCALTKETHHLINKDVMTALGRKGVIINIGRGALINEKELVEFAVKGEIGGAGLDVFENEPNVPKELFELDNVVLSPHNAVVTPEAFQAMQELVMANLEACFSNKPLRSLVKHE